MRELLDDERFAGGDVITPSRLPARATEGGSPKGPGCFLRRTARMLARIAA
jgi:hypothetical protein